MWCTCNGGAVGWEGGRDKTLRVWDVDSAQCVQVLEGHTDWVRGVAELPDGRVVTGRPDGARERAQRTPRGGEAGGGNGRCMRAWLLLGRGAVAFGMRFQSVKMARCEDGVLGGVFPHTACTRIFWGVLLRVPHTGR